MTARTLQSAWTTVLVSIAAIAFLLHSAGYFFLYDDFALLRHSADAGSIAIATGGFYRPLPLLLTRVQFLALGWNQPALYAYGAILLHLGNACLVGLLGSQLGLHRRGALAASLLFALSAPAAEAYFWFSGMFDRLAVSGVLGALIAGHASVSARTWPGRFGWAGLGLLSAAAALLSKETAVVLPILVLATASMSSRPRKTGHVVLYAAATALLVAIYLTWRQRTLPNLQGPDGDWRTLWFHADLLANAGSYALALAYVPLPGREASGIVRQASLVVPFVLGSSWLVVCAYVGKQRPRFLLAAFVAAIAGIVPVLWAVIPAGASASGRFLYLSGVWLALLPALAFDSSESLVIKRPGLVAGVVGWMVVAAATCQTASIVYQARIWAAAAQISRQSIEYMSQYQTLDRSLFITNLPAVFIEGPYVLKDYVFAAYYGHGFRPHVRVHKMALRLVDGRVWFAGWIDNEVSRPGDRAVRLPVRINQPEPSPRTEILSPSAGSDVGEPFVLSGWSVDTAGPIGCGADVVHVYAHAIDRRPSFIGAASIGLTSPGSATMFGTKYSSCGWSLVVSGLPQSSYVLTIHARDNAIADFAPPASIALRIVKGPQ